VFIQEAAQPRTSERASAGPHHPIRVAIYGSSLFLTAVAAALCNHPAIHLILFPNAVATAAILRQTPIILVWQDHYPPEDIAALLQAGLWLLNIDEQQSWITIQHRGRPRQTLAVQQSTDLVAWIMQATQSGVSL
jgi:hypothetical protein